MLTSPYNEALDRSRTFSVMDIVIDVYKMQYMPSSISELIKSPESMSFY
jgi:hypothetical protein